MSIQEKILCKNGLKKLHQRGMASTQISSAQSTRASPAGTRKGDITTEGSCIKSRETEALDRIRIEQIQRSPDKLKDCKEETRSHLSSSSSTLDASQPPNKCESLKFKNSMISLKISNTTSTESPIEVELYDLNSEEKCNNTLNAQEESNNLFKFLELSVSGILNQLSDLNDAFQPFEKKNEVKTDICTIAGKNINVFTPVVKDARDDDNLSDIKTGMSIESLLAIVSTGTTDWMETIRNRGEISLLGGKQRLETKTYDRTIVNDSTAAIDDAEKDNYVPMFTPTSRQSTISSYSKRSYENPYSICRSSINESNARQQIPSPKPLSKSQKQIPSPTPLSMRPNARVGLRNRKASSPSLQALKSSSQHKNDFENNGKIRNTNQDKSCKYEELRKNKDFGLFGKRSKVKKNSIE